MEKLNEYQWRLIANNLSLLKEAVHIYQKENGIPRGMNPEDLVSAATEGLISAVRSFNSEKGNFKPHALRIMVRSCIDSVRRLAGQHKMAASRRSTVFVISKKTDDRFVKCPVEEATQIDLLQIVTTKLSVKERLFVLLYYLLELKQEQAGKLAFGTVKSATWKRWENCKARLRAELSPVE